MKLPEEFKKKWIAALRSGKYKQGSGGLKRSDIEGDTYCCLGVACAVVGSKNIPDVEFIGEFFFPDEYSDRGLPYKPKQIPELLIGSNDVTILLAEMNDGKNGEHPKTFLEIADYIEANL